MDGEERMVNLYLSIYLQHLIKCTLVLLFYEADQEEVNEGRSSNNIHLKLSLYFKTLEEVSLAIFFSQKIFKWLS